MNLLSAIASVAALVAGVASWTLLEYVLHRWFHVSRGRDPGSREHLSHHARPDTFSAWWKKALFFAGVMLMVCWISFFFALGLAAAYLGYEWLHRQVHVSAPRTRYGAAVRERHFRHHFVDPSKSHGVSTGVWDVVFGTTLPEESVPVPRKLAHALPWLLDQNGEVRREYRGHYHLVPSRHGHGAGKLHECAHA